MNQTRQLLITGADGFVGRWLVSAALTRGWQVIAGISPDGADPSLWLSAAECRGVRVLRGDLLEPEYRTVLAQAKPDAVVHLAAVASGSAARENPVLAWATNAGATAGLAEALARGGKPRFLLISSGEVYGSGHSGPIPESAPLQPISPYAASKVGAEVAISEVARRTGLPFLIARPFPHTGPGQSVRYVFPAFVARLRQAIQDEAEVIPVGNLTPVRDLLDVRDVVSAYLGLLEQGEVGAVYNVASGSGESLAESLRRLSRMLGSRSLPREDPALVRDSDLPVLIGDSTLLRETTGWSPTRTREQIFRELIDAQAD